MTQTDRVILVSHGQPSDPETGRARNLRAGHGCRIVLARPARTGRDTGRARVALEAALEGAHAPLVYPFFMADGWFTQSALPKRLAGTRARQLPPFGLDAGLPGFADWWLAGVLAERGWSAAGTTLFVAGHGSGRSPRPAVATREFASALRLGFAEIRCGFVEQAPFLVEAAQGLPAQSICLPFFALKRGHVLDDLPEALQTTGFAGVLLEPFGLHPDLPGFLAARISKEGGGA